MVRIAVIRPSNTTEYRTNGHAVEFNAARVVNAVTKAVAAHHREAIQAGDKASGGSQERLGPTNRKRAGKGLRNAERGMGTEGKLPGFIRTTKGRGVVVSTARVSPVQFYDIWLHQEATRGVHYFYADGDVDDVVGKVLAAELKTSGLDE